MTIFTGRLPTLSPETAPEPIADILTRWPYNLHKTLSHSPDMMTAWMGFAEKVLLESSLSERDREIVILRVAIETQCDYEWGMHSVVARNVGMSEDDLAAIARGSASMHWTAHERALCAMVEELFANWRISDETWKTLSAQYSPQNMIDLMLLTGNFTLIATTLNGLEIEMEPGLEPVPAASE